jgi:hypothetical protein
MEWKDVGQIAAQFAPLVGTALGGPLGTGIGAIIASVFGVDAQPDKVADAIAADPQAALKLREIESNNTTELQKAIIAAGTLQIAEETKQIQAVNATMQIEAQSGHWPTWSWRPYWGFISGTAFLVVSVLVCILAHKAVLGKQPEALVMIPQLVTSFTLLFGIPGAILGVASYMRGKMQVEQAKTLPAGQVGGN